MWYLSGVPTRYGPNRKRCSMSKGNKSVPVVLQSPTQAAAPSTEMPASMAGTLQVKTGLAFRGARAAWYATLVQYNGKPATEWLEHVTAKRPSVYGPRSRHAGQPEPVPGWFRYFLRNGYASISKPAKSA